MSDAEEMRSHATRRRIAAPCAQVFPMFSDPRRLARWWGPEGFRSTFEEFDLRPGGNWRFTMHGPDGKGYWNECVFLEVVPNEKVVIEHNSAPHFILTITLAPDGDGTMVGWRQVFDSVEEYRRVGSFVPRANEQNLDKLAAEVYDAARGG